MKLNDESVMMDLEMEERQWFEQWICDEKKSGKPQFQMISSPYQPSKYAIVLVLPNQ
ncbi:hypothetical protein [Alicyclobacillus mengziensis]|uniref:Uncharacterized protein n=1 Tax=Alicyclobacillus mengziensis TaxID=2931921 RepID=A0A9X7VWD1_9BACL|nr:hypothetical protein [Alicyclobacillus mengziensis]QSO46075.1 hypothetical protein JZ786_16290 [Alicyclobacillus mengziensis]